MDGKVLRLLVDRDAHTAEELRNEIYFVTVGRSREQLCPPSGGQVPVVSQAVVDVVISVTRVNHPLPCSATVAARRWRCNGGTIHGRACA